MSPDEIERTMQFLLTQQAQFAADFEKLSGKTDRIADGLIGLTGMVGHLIASQQRTDEQMKETDKQLRETKARVGEVGEYIRTVESHLDVVIRMFERHLHEDPGQRPS